MSGRRTCPTCHGAHWVATGPDIADRDDCPRCGPTCDGYEYAPQGCDWCGRTSEVTEPTGYHDPAWLCTRCMADYRREAE